MEGSLDFIPSAKGSVETFKQGGALPPAAL